MAATLFCACGRQLQVSDEQSGLSARCPACGRVISTAEDQTAIWPPDPSAGARPPREVDAETETITLEPTHLTRPPPQERPPAPTVEGIARGPVPPRTSRKAVISLILGLLSPLLCIVGGVMAILWGVLALGEIRRSGNQFRGKGFALAGIVLGAAGILTSIVALIVALRQW
jgi:hypothetical protein